jgi:hypothetical protein
MFPSPRQVEGALSRYSNGRALESVDVLARARSVSNGTYSIRRPQSFAAPTCTVSRRHPKYDLSA